MAVSDHDLPTLEGASFPLTLPDTPELHPAGDLLPVHGGLRAAVEGGGHVDPTPVAVIILRALTLTVNTRQGGGQPRGGAGVGAGATRAAVPAGATGASRKQNISQPVFPPGQGLSSEPF